jgi:trehalose 6-phosphate phosphatase
VNNILSQSNRYVLQQYAWSNALLAFDYDGTLAPIVSHPARAAMRDSTRRLLIEVAARYPCIVVSGRAQRDVSHWLRGVPLVQVIGNHGVEPWQATPPLVSEVKRWTPLLVRDLAGVKGVWIEDKTFSIAIHYRQSREKKKARAAILEAAADLGPARLIGGKQVINILPEGAPHKGIALLRERDRLGCDTALYLGDDMTDEDVFELDHPGTARAALVRASEHDHRNTETPGATGRDPPASRSTRRPAGLPGHYGEGAAHRRHCHGNRGGGRAARRLAHLSDEARSRLRGPERPR